MIGAFALALCSALVGYAAGREMHRVTNARAVDWYNTWLSRDGRVWFLNQLDFDGIELLEGPVFPWVTGATTGRSQRRPLIRRKKKSLPMTVEQFGIDQTTVAGGDERLMRAVVTLSGDFTTDLEMWQVVSAKLGSRYTLEAVDD